MWSFPNIPRILLLYLAWLLVVSGSFLIAVFLVAHPALTLYIAAAAAMVRVGLFFVDADLSHTRRMITAVVGRVMRQLLHQHS